MNKYITTEKLYNLFINCSQKITTDTRKLEKGALFFALKGANFNANEFALKAIEEGCSYAIVDEEAIANNTTILLVKNVLESLQDLAKYHRKQLQIPIIGITGSNGKTTNKELIQAVLSKKYITYATIGNLNNHIGVPLTLLSLNSSHEMAIVEMGANHIGEIDMLCHLCDPDYGIITNIGKAHLEGFGGEEGVKIGKSELYKYLQKKGGKIFINGDDNVLNNLSEGLYKIYYGEKEEYDIYGKSYQNSEFVEFKWNAKHKDLTTQSLVKTHMFGHYNFINLLCAACVGNYFKVNTNDINSALATYIPEMNRSEVKRTETNTVILDAYNANPDSMYLSLMNFNKQTLINKIVVLGDMLELGEYSYLEHEKILSILQHENIKHAFLVGIQFLQLKEKYPNFLYFKDVSALQEHLTANKINNSTILIKGSRGIRLEKIIENL